MKKHWKLGGAALTLVLLFFFFLSAGVFSHIDVGHNDAKGTFCPTASRSEVRSCMVTTDWSNVIKMEMGTTGLSLWHSDGAIEDRNDALDDSTLYRYRVAKGKMKLCYILSATKPDLSKCEETA